MFIYQNVFFFFFALSQLKPCILALYLIISLDIHHNSTAFAQETHAVKYIDSPTDNPIYVSKQ